MQCEGDDTMRAEAMRGWSVHGTSLLALLLRDDVPHVAAYARARKGMAVLKVSVSLENKVYSARGE